jgi:dipeptidyl aminopeptidase/acylaminoacyl peptidase
MKKPVSVTFESKGANIHAIFYQGSGVEPLPTAILCHGFPGDEGDVFGLGGRLMKEGFNSLAFNYRGSWGSEGLFKDANSLEDVISAIHYMKSNSVAKEFNVDPSRIALIGYSYGGGMALLGSLSDAAVRRVVDIAGGNLGEAGRMMKQSDEFRRAIEKSIEEGASNAGLRANPKEIVSELLANLDKYDLLKHADGLSSKDILIIGGWRDQEADIEHHILPFIRALQRHGANQVQIEIFDSDHSFTNVRSQLADRIVSWLRTPSKDTEAE